MADTERQHDLDGTWVLAACENRPVPRLLAYGVSLIAKGQHAGASTIEEEA
jgi:hypothetical protein